MKRTVKFWTESEDQMLRTCMTKFESGNSAARWAAPKLDRTVSSVQQRISFLSRGITRTYKVPREKKVIKKNAVVQKGVTLPTGFTFDIKPSRVTMFEDHVRLYF